MNGILYIMAIVLVFFWLIGYVILHLHGIIHLLLIMAVFSIVFDLVINAINKRKQF